MENLKPSILLAMAFQIAKRDNDNLSKKWRDLSLQVGAHHPESLLLLSIQKLGDIDILIRSCEDEFKDTTDHHYQFMLSELWIGSFYEILRVLNRELKIQSEGLSELFNDFEVLRIPLEKYQIAKDRQHSCITLGRIPPNGNSDVYHYKVSDAQHAHIMPIALSARGSAMWQATDLRSNNSYWLERRELSERSLVVLSDIPCSNNHNI